MVPVRRSWLILSAVLALAVLAAVLVVVRSDGNGGGGGGGASPSPSPSLTTGVQPFTGLPGRPRPVLVVKIDNVRPARPQTGLGSADIVYVEQVEAGQSRLMAVFSSRPPSVAGPVRSARESDLELLRQFGRPALAYSGAQSKLLPLLHAAPVHELTPGGNGAGAFFRSGERVAPHNLYVRPGQALAAAPRASLARDIGFRFGAGPGGGRPTAEQSVSFPAARFGFTWAAPRDRWLISMDGRPAVTTDSGRLGAATVVIQYVTVRASRFQDRGGNVTPFSETVGSGKALVLRGGRAYDAHWSRPSAEGGTSFTTPDGSPLAFARGPVWVVLAAR
jgi:Protein of unknown function (DUF3048) N-terminal domain/Protein of unknown function (DUF3048) C-terminal domain